MITIIVEGSWFAVVRFLRRKWPDFPGRNPVFDRRDEMVTFDLCDR
jgi:hypothetical protein